MPENADNPLSFWQELKRRKVVRVITVYAAAAFVILELVYIIEDPLQLPDWTLALIIVLLCIGFIITVIFSWIYDITFKGIEKTKPAIEVKENIPEKPSVFNLWKVATIVSVVVMIGLVIFNVVSNKARSRDIQKLEKSIAVLPFDRKGAASSAWVLIWGRHMLGVVHVWEGGELLRVQFWGLLLQLIG